MTARAGRITIVRELDRYPGGGRRWAVLISTYEGTDSLTLTSWDENILPPMENETIQVISYGRSGMGIWVSSRQFSQWRNPEVQYRPMFEEYSRVHVPADPRKLAGDISRVVK